MSLAGNNVSCNQLFSEEYHLVRMNKIDFEQLLAALIISKKCFRFTLSFSLTL